MTKKSQVIRTDPELWEACKKEAIEKTGKFSARAMQHAVLLYKARGGEYIGAKSSDNALTEWNNEQSDLKN